MIVIPAYNEERRIGKTLEAYSYFFEEMRKVEGVDYEFLVVINNTTDRTEEIVKSFSALNKRIRYISIVQGGKGFAVIEGFKHVLNGEYDLIGFVDADMATSPTAFYDLVKNIGGSGGIIASRYVKGSKVSPKNTPSRIFASRVHNAIIRGLLLMPYRDTQCGAKLFSKVALKKIIKEIGMTQWAFDIELIYRIRKSGYFIKEVPTNWSSKEYSTINFWVAGPWMILAVIRLRILHSPFRKFVRIYDKIFGKIHRSYIGPVVVKKNDKK